MTWRTGPRYDRAMKTRNVMLSVAAVVVLAAAGAAWWLSQSLDGLVKQAINRYGPEIAGVAVQVASVKIEAANGRGSVGGLFVGNPKGFEAPYAMKVGEIRLAVDPASLTKDVVVIRELVLVAPDVFYERGQGSDNLTVIQKNVDAWVAQNVGAQKNDAPGRKYIVEHLRIRNGRAHFGTALSSPMPDLHLRDIGKRSNGASAAEVVKQVWGAMLGSVSNLASRAGSALKQGASGALDSVKKLFK